MMPAIFSAAVAGPLLLLVATPSEAAAIITGADGTGTDGKCCTDGSAPVQDGDHSTPPCVDGNPPSSTQCEETDAPATTGGVATVTWVVYTDNQCTQMHPNCISYGCSITLEVSDTCQQWTEASANAVTCTDDKITYNNFPNTGTKHTSTGATACDQSRTRPNELKVGVCQYFAGPVPNWKMIDASTHSCAGNADDTCDGVCAKAMLVRRGRRLIS